MTANHPYPEHVYQAVTQAISDFYESPSAKYGADADVTDVALQALWDASRVEDHNLATLPQGTILEWHDGAIVRMSGSFPYQVAYGREVLKPYAHVIWWG